MFTAIIMHRQNGFAITCHPGYEPALDSCVDATRANSETTAVIYNSEGQLIWRIFGKLEAPAPVATEWRVRDTRADIEDAIFPDFKAAIRDAKSNAVHFDREFHVLGADGKSHFIAIPNPRSIFSDIDTAGDKQ